MRIDCHFHRRMAAWAADFEMARARASVRTVVRTSFDLRTDMLRCLPACRGYKTKLSEFFRKFRHQFRMGGDEHFVRDDFASETTVPAVINDCLKADASRCGAITHAQLIPSGGHGNNWDLTFPTAVGWS